MIATVYDRRGAWEQVSTHIKSLVFAGELRRGDRVPQDEIAAELGISRIPVREALIALEREAWVKIIPHRGAFVVGFDDSSITDHYEVLGLVYGLVARRAATTATAAQVSALAPLQRTLADAAKTGDADEFLEANDRFLAELRKLGGSPRISSILRSISGIVPGNFFAVVDGAAATATKGTSAVVRAIKDGDAERAADAMVTMLRHHGRAVTALLRANKIVE